MNTYTGFRTRILENKPVIEIAAAGEFTLNVEIDLHNGSIVWLIAKNDIEISDFPNWAFAIDKFYETVGDNEIEFHI